MKLSLVAIVIAMLLTFVYFDRKAREQAYHFCQLHSIGGSIDEVKNNAEVYGFSLRQLDKNTLLFIRESSLAHLKIHGCEIKFAKGKITLQSYIEQ